MNKMPEEVLAKVLGYKVQKGVKTRLVLEGSLC